MKFDITILGTNSALPAHGRFPTSQFLHIQDYYYLVDCGEGTQMRLTENKVKWGKIKCIFISHLHGDHVYGLVGLLTSYNLFGRKEELLLFGPEGIKELVESQLRYSYTTLNFPLQIKVVDTTLFKKIHEDKTVEVWSIPLLHRVPTNGFLFREKQRPPNIKSEQIENYQLSIPQILEVKQGNDLILSSGERIPNDQLVNPAPLPRSYAFCSDTMYTESILPYIDGVDVLYHESTFLNDDQERAKTTMHSTAKEAAQIALKAKVGKLILGHYSSRQREVKPFEEEARALFPNSIAGVEGLTIEIPFNSRSK